jgi:hypothetical protein
MGDNKLPLVLPSAPLGESESLQELIGDCRRMAEHWKAPAAERPDPVAPAGPHGITVPPASARAVSGMPDYGG